MFEEKGDSAPGVVQGMHALAKGFLEPGGAMAGNGGAVADGKPDPLTQRRCDLAPIVQSWPEDTPR